MSTRIILGSLAVLLVVFSIVYFIYGRKRSIRLLFTDNARFVCEKHIFNRIAMIFNLDAFGKNKHEYRFPTTRRLFDILAELSDQNMPKSTLALGSSVFRDIMQTVHTLKANLNNEQCVTLFKNVARRGLLSSSSAREIINSREVREMSIDSIYWMHLMRYTLYMCEMDLEQNGCSGYVVNRPCFDRYDKAKVLWCKMNSLTIRKTPPLFKDDLEMVWAMLSWFMGKIGIHTVTILQSVSRCFENNIQGIDMLEIETLLILSWASAGFFSRILRKGSPLNRSLKTLNLRCDKINMSDMVAISRTPLISLSMSNSLSHQGMLVPLAEEGAVIRDSLMVFSGDNNSLGLEDIIALTKMPNLTNVYIYGCILIEGSFVPFGDRSAPFNGSFRRLIANTNRFDLDDIEALSHTRLTELSIENCSLGAGSLLVLSGPDSTIMNTLEHLNISYNNLSPDDIEVLSGFSNLTNLLVNDCNLPGDSFRCFGRDDASARSLAYISANNNNLSRDDIYALSTQPIKSLWAKNTGITLGSLEAFAKPGAVIRTTLEELYVSKGSLCVMDMRALSCLKSIQHLELEDCNIQEGYVSELLARPSSVLSRIKFLTIKQARLNRKDVEMIGCAHIEEVMLDGCTMEVGDLKHMESTLSKLQTTGVLHINAAFISLGLARMLSRMDIKKLSITDCQIDGGLRNLFGDKGSPLSMSINHLSLNNTKVANYDIAVISGLSLTALEISNSQIKCGDLEPLGKPKVRIQSTLQTLNVSNNNLDMRDIRVISKLHVEELNISNCGVPAGHFVPFNEAPIQEMVRSSSEHFRQGNVMDRVNGKVLLGFKNLSDRHY